ncbi:MAG: hypothetical protein QOI73_454, partial [Solirubrobacteraceae bacterium]|nr:hypothetical protein [Solirubrobacteraceae bacterium]
EAGDRAQDGATVERVATLRADVVAWSRRLASAPGRATIDHNDLHARNVLLGDDGESWICDWGDSVVAHPFSSMLVTLSVVRERMLGCCGLDDPRLLRVRDAYLEPFAGLAPHAELVRTLELACRLSKVTRALTWQWVLDALDPRDVREEWRRAPLECLQSLAADSYLGAP